MYTQLLTKKTAYELYTYHILSHFIDFLNFFARMLFKVSILEFMSSTIRFRNSVNIPFCSENSVYAFQGTPRLYIYNFLEHFVDTTELLTYAKVHKILFNGGVNKMCKKVVYIHSRVPLECIYLYSKTDRLFKK